MSLHDRERLKMKSKRGVIPLWAWNQLVDMVYGFAITHVEGGKLRRGVGFGSSLIIDPAAGSDAGVCQLGDYQTDPDDDTKVLIIPGWLHAPNKSELIEPQSITPAADTAVWIKCPWTATLNDDDVLEAGGDLGTPVVETGASVPDNSTPDVDTLTGTLYVPLGAWNSDEVWIRQGCGSITVGFCPRVFTISRGETT